MNVQFPILLTVAQPGTTTTDNVHDDFPECEPRDLFLATYHQGESVALDWIDKRFKPVAATTRSDEFAIDCLVDGREPVGPIIFGLNDTFVLKQYGKKIRRLPSEIGSLPQLSADRSGVYSIAPQPDGRKQLVLTDIKGGQTKTILAAQDKNIIDFQIGCCGGLSSTNDNPPIFVALGNNKDHPGEASEILTVDSATGDTQPFLSNTEWHLNKFTVSLTGDAIAYVNEKDGQVYCQDSHSSALHQISIPQLEEEEDERTFRQCPQFSPDGSRLVYITSVLRSSYDGGNSAEMVGSLYVAPVHGGALRTLIGQEEEVLLDSAIPAGLPKPKMHQEGCPIAI